MTAPELDTILESAGTFLRTSINPGVRVEECIRIPGQASNRAYYRLLLSGAEHVPSVILVKLPDDPFASEEAADDGGVRELPFCSMQRYLGALGLPVPTILADATGEGYILQEDLGEVTMFAQVKGAGQPQTAASYRQAIELLVEFQTATWGEGAPPSIGHGREFTLELLRWELDHFKEWLLLAHAGARLSSGEEQVVEEEFDHMAGDLRRAPYMLSHRDYQSTNLMVCERGLVLIDFQDALMAPLPYDLVALLRDSYVHLSPGLVDELVAFYFSLAADLLPMDEEEYVALFHLQTLQRKLKDAGRFVFIDRVKGNPSFMKWVEPTLGYVANAFDALPRYAKLREVLGQHVPSLASP